MLAPRLEEPRDPGRVVYRAPLPLTAYQQVCNAAHGYEVEREMVSYWKARALKAEQTLIPLQEKQQETKRKLVQLVRRVQHSYPLAAASERLKHVSG